MKNLTTLIAGLIGLLLMAAVAQSADKSFEWTAEPLAVSYRIDMKVLDGTPDGLLNIGWQLGVAMVAAPTVSVLVTFPDGALVIFRAVAINAAGMEAVNYSSGAWYNSAWELPPAVVGLGIGE